LISDTKIFTLRGRLEPNLSGRISPDSIAELFEALASYKNGVIEVRVSGQQQERMGFR
jgi:hypothetical protein